MKVTDAVSFKYFMESIWEIRTRTTKDGVALLQHPDYDRYQNAIHSAERFGMRRTGGTKVNGENAHVYRFPDNGQGVVIGYGGNWLKLTHNRFSHRKESTQ